MQDYVARQPIMNGKAQVCAYRLALGRSIRHSYDEDDGEAPVAGSGKNSVFAVISNQLSDHKPVYIDFFEELRDTGDTQSRERLLGGAVIIIGKDIQVGRTVCARLKAQGYKLAFDSAYFTDGAPETELADMMIVEFTSVSLAAQAALIRKYKNRVTFLAEKIENWSDFKVAKDMGYDVFQGFFFLWPPDTLLQKEIKSLDVCLVGILQELEKPEPEFRVVSEMIEHDLALSYKLLRLVNSAYMAPKYQIRSITQALTYIGTRELHQWISMLLFNGIRSEENSELVVMSLIRGKMAALVARELELPETGSEPYFTGLFSLIDVILNRDMNAILSGLPLSDDVKAALLGSSNALTELLDFVVSYEQAAWHKIEGKYPMNRIPPHRMVSIYLEAHQWSKLLDSQHLFM